MDKYLSLIPKNVLAFLAVAGGIAFIVLSQPPHTVCDSQIEIINQSEARLLFKDPKSKITTTRYERLRDQCKGTNTPGGCYELFQEVKTLLRDMNALPTDCAVTVGNTSEYRRALWETVELLVRLGWGDTPPQAYTTKFGWLDTADVSLFCRLQDRVVSIFGESSWANFREKMMHELPGAKDMPRNQVWDLSIISENCARYP